MTLDYIKGKIVFTCDSCDDNLETETNNWSEAQEMRKAENWLAELEGPGSPDWLHFCCVTCKKDFRDKEDAS